MQEIKKLREENEILREEIIRLRKQIYDRDAEADLLAFMCAPRRYKLTPSEGVIVAALYKTPGWIRRVKLENILDNYRHKTRIASEINLSAVLDVLKCKINKKAGEIVVEYSTTAGYRLSDTARASIDHVYLLEKGVKYNG